MGGRMMTKQETDRMFALMKEKGIEDPEKLLRTDREEIETRYGRIPSVPKWMLKYGSFCKS